MSHTLTLFLKFDCLDDDGSHEHRQYYVSLERSQDQPTDLLLRQFRLSLLEKTGFEKKYIRECYRTAPNVRY